MKEADLRVELLFTCSAEWSQFPYRPVRAIARGPSSPRLADLTLRQRSRRAAKFANFIR